MRERKLLDMALEGQVKSHDRFILMKLLFQINKLDEVIERFNKQDQEYYRPLEEAIILLDTIPGVGREIAEIIVSEIGTDMSRFPTAEHQASWAGVAPDNDESAGKRCSSKTTKGNKALSSALNLVAHTASHTKETYLSAQYCRVAARRGKRRRLLPWSILSL